MVSLLEGGSNREIKSSVFLFIAFFLSAPTFHLLCGRDKLSMDVLHYGVGTCEIRTMRLTQTHNSTLENHWEYKHGMF